MTGRLARFGLVLVLLVSGSARPSAAQTAGDEVDAELRSMLGRQIARVALMDYRVQAEPTPDDAAIAADLLALASSYRPDDPHVLRYLIEARRAAGDEDGVMAATRRLLTIDPDDEIAMLRLLAWQISRRQTVEQRLAAYAFLIDGDGARELADNPAVISRLALDAALLHRERGETRAFLERLDQAASLDSTHKEAATLVATYYAEHSDDPIGLLELTINVLLADPVDPNVHFSIADQLTRLGAYQAAARFHENGRFLASTFGESDTPSLVTESTGLAWHVLGPELLLEFLEGQLAGQRRAVEDAIRRRTELNEPINDLPDPSEILLTLERERYRLYAAVATGNRVSAERSIADMDATVLPILDALAQRLTEVPTDDQATRIALIQRAVQYAADPLLARLLADVGIEQARRQIAQLEQAYGGRVGDQFGIVKAFELLRTGDAESAAAAFEPFADKTLLGAIGAGLTAEQIGDPDRAASLYKRAGEFAPRSPGGAFARTRWEAVTGQVWSVGELGGQAEAVAAAVPPWIDTVARRPDAIIRLDASLEQTRIAAFDEPRIMIEIRSLLPTPVAMGGDRPVSTRFALSPSLDVASFSLSSSVTPEVVDIHRKLRLEPGEIHVAEVWPDAGYIGWLAELKAGHRLRGRFHALQGFISGAGRPFNAGPLSKSAETELLVRVPEADVRLSSEEMIRVAEVSDESRVLRLLPAMRAALIDVDRPGGPMSDSDAEALARSLAGRYASGSRTLRAGMLTILPQAHVRPSLAALDEAAAAETDPQLVRLLLITRATDAASATVGRAAASDDAGLAAFAAQLRARLAGDSPRGYQNLPIPSSHLPDEIQSGGSDVP
ncbi:MAG: hypothetical protein AAGB48_10850 [Planctomycetota bacterium]